MSCACDLTAAAVHRWDCGMDPLEAERQKTAHLAQALARAVRRIDELENQLGGSYRFAFKPDHGGTELWTPTPSTHPTATTTS